MVVGTRVIVKDQIRNLDPLYEKRCYKIRPQSLGLLEEVNGDMESI